MRVSTDNSEFRALCDYTSHIPMELAPSPCVYHETHPHLLQMLNTGPSRSMKTDFCRVTSLTSLRNTQTIFLSPERNQFSMFSGGYELRFGHWNTVCTLFLRARADLMQISANVKATSTNNIPKCKKWDGFGINCLHFSTRNWTKS